MNKITITSIFWKYKAIGIDIRKLAEENLVEVTVEDKNGNRLLPNLYKIRRDLVLNKYKVEALEHKPEVQLVYIPIDELEQYIDVGRTAIFKFDK